MTIEDDIIYYNDKVQISTYEMLFMGNQVYLSTSNDKLNSPIRSCIYQEAVFIPDKGYRSAWQVVHIDPEKRISEN